jgi:hypothetical protein
MYPKANFISRNADLCRRLCRLPLSGYEEFMAQQLDRTEQLFIRHCHAAQTGRNPTPALVTEMPARRPTLIQAAEERAPFPESLTVLVAERAQTKQAATALAA